jgi:hypothetical protein
VLVRSYGVEGKDGDANQRVIVGDNGSRRGSQLRGDDTAGGCAVIHRRTRLPVDAESRDKIEVPVPAQQRKRVLAAKRAVFMLAERFYDEQSPSACYS